MMPMARRPLALAADVTLAVVGYIAAWTLRFGADLPLFVPFARRALAAFVFLQIVGVVLAGGYRALSVPTLVRFTVGTLIGSAAGAGFVYWRFGAAGLSLGALAGAAILFVLAGAGWRAVATVIARRRRTVAAMEPPAGMRALTGPPKLGLGLSSLYHYRGLVRALVAKDLKLKYRGSVLGVAWSLLNPLALVGVYTIAFQVIMPQKQEHFVFSLLIGLLAWTFFAGSAAMSSGAIVDSGNLLKSVRFPRAILPVAVVAFNFAQYLLTLAVFLPIMFVWSGLRPGVSIVAIPVVLALLAVFTTGIALIVAAATARYRDVRHLLDISLSLMFWLTPIIYTAAQLPERLRLPVLLNPMSSFITALRDIVLHGAWPSPTLWMIATAYAAVTMALGATIFLSVEDDLAEQI